MQWVALGTKAGPPAAAEDTGPSYRHQNQVTQTGKVQFALGRHQRVGAGVAVAVVVRTEQPIVGALGVGQHAAGGGSVDESPFQQEADKAPLRHVQLLGGGAQVGTVVQVDEQVVVDGFALQPGIVLPQRPRFSRAQPAGRCRASAGLPGKWRPPTACPW